MKVKDLHGRYHSWNLVGYEPRRNDKRSRSDPHIRARHLLRGQFPTDKILEEVPLPGTSLRCDFFLPIRNLMVEVHGRQHFQFVKHFHGDMKGFLDSKRRDEEKSQWCDINGITLLVLKDDEDDERWRVQIERA